MRRPAVEYILHTSRNSQQFEPVGALGGVVFSSSLLLHRLHTQKSNATPQTNYPMLKVTSILSPLLTSFPESTDMALVDLENARLLFRLFVLSSAIGAPIIITKKSRQHYSPCSSTQVEFSIQFRVLIDVSDVNFDVLAGSETMCPCSRPRGRQEPACRSYCCAIVFLATYPGSTIAFSRKTHLTCALCFRDLL